MSGNVGRALRPFFRFVLAYVITWVLLAFAMRIVALILAMTFGHGIINAMVFAGPTGSGDFWPILLLWIAVYTTLLAFPIAWLLSKRFR